jgi:hypothetical protein
MSTPRSAALLPSDQHEAYVTPHPALVGEQHLLHRRLGPEGCEIGNAVDVLIAGEIVVRLQDQPLAGRNAPEPAAELREMLATRVDDEVGRCVAGRACRTAP